LPQRRDHRVALMLVAILHVIRDDEHPRQIIERLTGARDIHDSGGGPQIEAIMIPEAVLR